jgi:hypothetical protein
MSKIRVLMANEPRSYREAIALALQAARPYAEVVTAEPEALDDEVERFGPRLVICSRVTAFVEAEVPVWVELYSDHGPNSTVSFGGKRSTVVGMELEDLIHIFDRTRSISLGAV